MGWPHKVYLATGAKGIYYTDEFTASGDQPVWNTINGGLTDTAILSFSLDTHEAVPQTRMYCVTSEGVHRRTTGDWTLVLSNNDTGAAYGETLKYLVVDKVTGFVYVTCAVHDGGTAEVIVFRSNDHGESWENTVVSPLRLHYSVGSIDAYDGLVVVAYIRSSLNQSNSVSFDNGVSWTHIWIGGTSVYNFLPVRINPLYADTWYGGRAKYGYIWNLVRCYVALGVGHVEELPIDSAAAGYSQGGWWFDPNDIDHALVLTGFPTTIAKETTDRFATFDRENTTDISYLTEIADDCEAGFLVFGCQSVSRASGRAPIYVSTDGYTLTNRSGANWESYPFTDSIPEDCGGVVMRGLWVTFPPPTSEGPTPPPGETITPPGGSQITLGGIGNVQGVTMPDYTGDERGVPMPGDRAAWDETLYGSLHARDIKDATFIHHMDPEHPLPRRYDQLLDVDTTGVVDGDAMLYDETTEKWLPADVLTPTEHTAIGDAAPHHAEVTLGAGNDADMATLFTQELTVVLKDHDHSVAGEGGKFALTNLSSGTTAAGRVPVADGAGAIAWGPAYSGEVLMQDGVTAPPVPIETEEQDDWLYEG